MKIPLDKQYHLAAGFTAAIVFGIPYPWFGLLIAIIGGILKEVYDYFHPDNHTVDFYDFVATALGGFVGFLIMQLIYN